MLERWKDKIKKWLDNSSEEEFEPTNNQSQPVKQQIETKVVYQYPTKKNFNFPIIPDETNASPKSRTARSDRQETAIQQPPYNQNIKSKKDFVNRKPFRPSSVPSPVHGFRERPNEATNLETPAFLRKKETYTEVVETKELNDKLNDAEDNLDQETDQIAEMAYGNDIDNVETTVEIGAAHTEQILDIQEEVVNHKEMQPTLGATLSIANETSTSPDENSLENKKEQRKTSKQPFNVRMRPSDKKRYFERKKQESNIQVSPKRHKQPPYHLLNDSFSKQTGDDEWVSQQAVLLENTLKQFHVNAKVIATMQGPTVTRFEIQPEAGVKVSKIKNLSDDIKLNMAAKDIRMEAPIPGKNAIGIEIPNKQSKAVGLQEIFESEQFQTHRSSLNTALGLDIAGNPIVTDIKKMPHGLIAGATGSGKSVCINTILVSLLYHADPEDVKLMLIDPKMVELAPYNEIPHLVAPVITDVKAATHALKWAVAEMENRYERFVKEGTRDIERYNEKLTKQQRTSEKMPYIVIVIDELADLMMMSPQDVEDAICRIAQKARACGIHLLLATQRPSVDVITGLIKANIPTRIAFSVSSQVDSRTIIDTNGAERLLGKGDMLFVENGARQAVRIQGAFVTDDEIERVTSYVKKLAPANYLFEQEELLQQVETEAIEDDLYPEVLSFVIEQQGASASLLQRRFKIGYNRAARLIDTLEDNGIISAQKGSKPRDVLVSSANWNE
ncbi:hypothetical protein Pryu01_01414 [Paraliobacillus ryukyuensis]|uniref:S-DNA-T family DNA segregation ATPase FtsK/SpoIIIE n=1 Tax=Paraliobacillus ryukyuensis TaxID=200904 RepID=A0A366ECY2_9BACI|nr:DNA translocase FtsK [Paraliobacillus ryukyuensis]RBO99354.1 S-DNA-T family DNA segregation ATPase FtsK/SpoIIIE [Paraliobacillus ryukyuensis]